MGEDISNEVLSIGFCELIVLKFKFILEGGMFVNNIDLKKSNILDVIDFNKNTLFVINKITKEEYETL